MPTVPNPYERRINAVTPERVIPATRPDTSVFAGNAQGLQAIGRAVENVANAYAQQQIKEDTQKFIADLDADVQQAKVDYNKFQNDLRLKTPDQNAKEVIPAASAEWIRKRRAEIMNKWQNNKLAEQHLNRQYGAFSADAEINAYSYATARERNFINQTQANKEADAIDYASDVKISTKQWQDRVNDAIASSEAINGPNAQHALDIYEKSRIKRRDSFTNFAIDMVWNDPNRAMQMFPEPDSGNEWGKHKNVPQEIQDTMLPSEYRALLGRLAQETNLSRNASEKALTGDLIERYKDTPSEFLFDSLRSDPYMANNAELMNKVSNGINTYKSAQRRQEEARAQTRTALNYDSISEFVQNGELTNADAYIKSLPYEEQEDARQYLNRATAAAPSDPNALADALDQAANDPTWTPEKAKAQYGQLLSPSDMLKVTNKATATALSREKLDFMRRCRELKLDAATSNELFLRYQTDLTPEEWSDPTKRKQRMDFFFAPVIVNRTLWNKTIRGYDYTSYLKKGFEPSQLSVTPPGYENLEVEATTRYGTGITPAQKRTFILDQLSPWIPSGGAAEFYDSDDYETYGD